MRLVSLQILDHTKYKALAEGQRSFFESLEPKRGEVVTKDSKTQELYPLAMNKVYFQIYVVPREVENPDEVARVVSQILDMDINEIYSKVTKDKDDPYEPIADKVEKDKIDQIESSNLKGVHFQEKYFRAYPEGSLASHILGYLGYDNEGVLRGFGGVEAYYNSELQGEKGEVELERDAAGRWIPIGSKDEKPAKDGDTIVLTIDRSVQAVLEKELRTIMEKLTPDSVSGVFMEPKTGKIIAMSNLPNYDPNKYNEVENVSIFNNNAVFDVFEPGSIFKPFVVASALDQGVINPEDKFNDSGAVKIGSYTIRNSDNKGHGEVSVVQALDKSLNVVMVEIARKVGIDKLYPYYEKFGFNSYSGIDLLGENIAGLDDKKKWQELDLATSSFGQGKIVLNAMQILKAYSSFANGGAMVNPRIVEKFIHPDGTESVVETKFDSQPISSKTATTISAMLISNVENGYSHYAKVNGYTIAGKTGTAQMPNKDKPGYGGEKLVSFVGYGPVEDPEVIAIIWAKNPKGSSVWGETIAAPVFSKVASFIFQDRQIIPTE